MKLIVQRMSPHTGHDTLVLDAASQEAATLDFAGSLVAIANEVVKNYDQFLAIVAAEEAKGLTELEVLVMPRMVGG